MQLLLVIEGNTLFFEFSTFGEDERMVCGTSIHDNNTWINVVKLHCQLES